MTGAILAWLEGVAEGLGAVQAEQAGAWKALWLALGRATEAAATGDVPELVRWLEEVADHEHELVGDCERVGAVLDALDAEPVPPTVPTGSAPGGARC